MPAPPPALDWFAIVVLFVFMATAIGGLLIQASIWYLQAVGWFCEWVATIRRRS